MINVMKNKLLFFLQKYFFPEIAMKWKITSNCETHVLHSIVLTSCHEVKTHVCTFKSRII